MKLLGWVRTIGKGEDYGKWERTYSPLGPGVVMHVTVEFVFLISMLK